MNSNHTNQIKQVGLLLTAASLLLAAKPAEAVVGDIASFVPNNFSQDSGTVTAVNSSNNINQASFTGGNGFDKYFTTDFLLLGAENSDTTIPLDNLNTVNNSRNDSIALSPVFQITQSHIDRNLIDIGFNSAFNGNNSATTFDDFQISLVEEINGTTTTAFSRLAPGNYTSGGTSTARVNTSNLTEGAGDYRLQIVLNESTSAGSSAAGFNDLTVTSVPFEFSPSQGLLAVGGFWGVSAFIKRRKANTSKLDLT